MVNQQPGMSPVLLLSVCSWSGLLDCNCALLGVARWIAPPMSYLGLGFDTNIRSACTASRVVGLIEAVSTTDRT